MTLFIVIQAFLVCSVMLNMALLRQLENEKLKTKYWRYYALNTDVEEEE